MLHLNQWFSCNFSFNSLVDNAFKRISVFLDVYILLFYFAMQFCLMQWLSNSLGCIIWGLCISLWSRCTEFVLFTGSGMWRQFAVSDVRVCLLLLHAVYLSLPASDLKEEPSSHSNNTNVSNTVTVPRLISAQHTVVWKIMHGWARTRYE